MKNSVTGKRAVPGDTRIPVAAEQINEKIKRSGIPAGF
jgi:hypothetical protein